jgi:hypothetical protein
MDAWHPKHVEDQDTIKWKWKCIKLVTLLWYQHLCWFFYVFAACPITISNTTCLSHSFKVLPCTHLNPEGTFWGTCTLFNCHMLYCSFLLEPYYTQCSGPHPVSYLLSCGLSAWRMGQGSISWFLVIHHCVRSMWRRCVRGMWLIYISTLKVRCIGTLRLDADCREVDLWHCICNCRRWVRAPVGSRDSQ